MYSFSFWAQRAQPSSLRGSGWMEPQFGAGLVLVVHDRSLGKQTMTWASKNEFKSCQGSGCASKAQPPPKRPRDGEEVPGPAVCVFGATCKAMLLRKVLQEVCLALVLQALTWFVFLDLAFETRPFRTAVLANSPGGPASDGHGRHGERNGTSFPREASYPGLRCDRRKCF